MLLKFTPIIKTLVWGTENWVLSSVPGSESLVSEGPYAGKTLPEVYGEPFPLLIKFIDARRDLSIQVHPDDALAKERHHGSGKTEMWYVIRAAEDAHIISGLSKHITPEDYVSLVEQDRIIDVLADHKANAGDVFYIPAGRIHSIGGGCYLAEIQQTSDITYRIYDYNRPGLDGKPRELHTALAKDAVDYSVLDDYRTHYEARRDEEVTLVDCPYFRTSLLELTAPFSLSVDDDSFRVLVCAGGCGSVRCDTEYVSLSEGEAVLATGPDSVEIVPDTTGGCIKLLAVTD